MASAAEVERVRRVLNQLSAEAWSDFLRAFGDLPKWDQQLARRALEGAWPELIDTYGSMAASFGADVFEEWADGLGVRRPVLEMAAGVDEARAVARAGWALTTPDVLGNMRGLVDELTKQPFRSTLQDSALRTDGVGWARVPSGATTCAWCLILASRGGVYTSKEMAQLGRKGKKYHGSCDCQPVLVRGPEDYPEGYDPGALYDAYSSARENAGSTDGRAVAAELRRIAPVSDAVQP